MIRRLLPRPIKVLSRRLRTPPAVVPRAADLSPLSLKMDRILEELGRIQGRQLEDIRGPIQRHEFRVYSHAGEDGIIQFLIRTIALPTTTFVEFGVEDYREANTRFLALNNHWTGLVMDGSEANIGAIRSDPVLWNAGVTARAAFITRENINEVLIAAGISGDIGLLSVDVDGNDYWIFDAITAVRPAIAVVEYNHRFGPSRAATIPYDPNFVRRRADSSWLCCGASLRALVVAAERKGMSLVGCCSFGNNAFFVRTELLPPWLPALTAADGYVRGTFRESMLIDGLESTLTPAEEIALVEEAELIDVEAAPNSVPR